jgi:hypothetical protein
MAAMMTADLAAGIDVATAAARVAAEGDRAEEPAASCSQNGICPALRPLRSQCSFGY